MNSLELRKAIRAKFAWPGGYPIYLVMSDGGSLCMDCAKSEYPLIARSNRDNSRDGWKPEGVDVNWEDSALYCDHCSKRIESAYAEGETQA